MSQTCMRILSRKCMTIKNKPFFMINIIVFIWYFLLWKRAIYARKPIWNYEVGFAQLFIFNQLLTKPSYVQPMRNIRMQTCGRLREGCNIKKRWNLGHCPNLSDLPPFPKTWDANFWTGYYSILKINYFKWSKKMLWAEMSSINGTTLLFDEEKMFNFRFKIRFGTFGQSFRPPSLLLGQCPR